MPSSEFCKHQMKPSAQRKVKALPGNGECCDCGRPNPDWACLKFGNLFCLNCSGLHRSLGTHISFVRSIDMDSWTKEQILIMKTGGNEQCNNFLASHGIDPRNTSIKEKYSHPAAYLYKDVLKARIEGRPEPTELPIIKELPKKNLNQLTSFSSHSYHSTSSSDDGGSGDEMRTKEPKRKSRRHVPSWVAKLTTAIPQGINNAKTNWVANGSNRT